MSVYNVERDAGIGHELRTDIKRIIKTLVLLRNVELASYILLSEEPRIMLLI